jgi:hypothetical protein
MDKKGWNVWSDITFKTQGYRKNFDLITENENIISEYTGSISVIRLAENKPTLIIGEYSFSVWDISMAMMLKIDLNRLLSAHKMVTAYLELKRVISQMEFDINRYDKIILIHSFVIHPKFRKIGIAEEFIEFIYRDYHYDKTAILALVQPFQDNDIDLDYYMNQKDVQVINDSGSIPKIEFIRSGEYYHLNDFLNKIDVEINEYKLFAVAKRCGFQRIDESHLFNLNSNVVLDRIREKQQIQRQLNKISDYPDIL